MFAILAKIALSVGVPQKAAKAVGIIAAIALLIAIFSVAKCTYDQSIIDAHDAKVNQETLEGALTATQKADDAEATRREQQAADAARVEGAITNATQAHPTEARRPSGPATNAALDELRRKQTR